MDDVIRKHFANLTYNIDRLTRSTIKIRRTMIIGSKTINAGKDYMAITKDRLSTLEKLRFDSVSVEAALQDLQTKLNFIGEATITLDRHASELEEIIEFLKASED